MKPSTLHYSDRPRTIAFLILSVLAILIGLLVPLRPMLDWDWSPQELGTWGWVAMAVTIVLGALPWLLWTRGSMDFFEPVYFVSLLYVLVFFLRPLQILYDYHARSRFMPADLELFQWVLLVGALGFVCFRVGYASRIGASMGRRLPNVSGPWQHHRVVRIAAMYTLIGIVGFSFAATQAGGFSLFFGTLRGRRLLGEQGYWILASTLVLVQAATIVVGTYYFKTRRLGALFVFSLVLSVAAGLSLGSRSEVLIVLVTLLVIFYYLRRFRPGRLVTNTVLIGLFAGAALLFVVTQVAVRKQLLEGGELGEISLTSLATEDIASRFLDEFSQFDWFVIVRNIAPRELPFQYGKTFLEFFSRFVPRAIWPEKPDPISFRISMMVGGARSGHPSTILGELYLNFNVLGIIVGSLIIGIILRALYAYLQQNRSNPAVILLYAYTFASLHRFFTRAFAPKMFGFLLFLVPTILALRLVEQRKGRKPAQDLDV